MTYNLLRSDGIGALACVSSASGDASFLQCTFQVKYDCKRPRATFSLQYKTDVHGIKQVFDLIYDADNLLPTTTKCQISTRALLPGDVLHVARSNLPELRVLSLHLRKPCPIICPDVESCQIPSRHLVDLAKSENIEIVFDWKWLDSERGSSFTSIVGQPERFSGFSIDQKNLKKRQRQLRDWTIFSPEEENVVVSKEPPPYTDPVHKRPRQEVSSSPSPPTKRVFVIPPGSPTERATTASPPDSPRHTFSASGKSQFTTFLRAVSAHSRFHDEKSLSPNAETDTNVPFESKDDIRSIMLDILPVMLASFIDCRRSVSPSSSSSTEPDTHPTTAPSRESIRQLRSLLTQRAAECIEKKLRTICENVQDDANCLRQAVDEEFLAVVAEEKWDISQRKEDALEELGVEIDKVIQEKLIEFSDELDCLVEQAGVNVEKAIDMRAEKSINTTWNKAIASSLLNQETRVGNKARGQGAHAAGDRKRKFYKFRSRTR